MDPISHLCFGRILYWLDDRNRLGAGSAVALVGGSVLPDVDAALVSRGMDVYLLHHQAGTHSLLGTVVEAALLATLLFWWRRGARWLLLFIAAWLGVLGHVFWDLADGSDLRLFAPFSDQRFGLHLVAMAEPLVALPLAVGVFWLGRRPEIRRRGGLAVLLWLVSFLGVKEVSRRAAEAVYARELAARGEPVTRHRREEVWGSVAGWRFLDRAGDRLRLWHIDAWTRQARVVFERALAPEDARIAASRQLPVIENFLRAAAIPFAWVESDGERSLVLWSDLQYCGPVGCAMVFGGAFDLRSTPLAQWVQLGSIRLARPLPGGAP